MCKWLCPLLIYGVCLPNTANPEHIRQTWNICIPQSHLLLRLEAEQISSQVGEQENTSAMLPVRSSSQSLRINNSRIFSMKETNFDPTSDETTPTPFENHSNTHSNWFCFSVPPASIRCCVLPSKAHGGYYTIKSVPSPLTLQPVGLFAGHMTTSVRRKGRESDADGRERFWGQRTVSEGEKNKERWQEWNDLRFNRRKTSKRERESHLYSTELSFP